MKKNILLITAVLLIVSTIIPQQKSWLTHPSSELSVFLRSREEYKGNSDWEMIKYSDADGTAEDISSVKYKPDNWLKAVVPGTVLNSLVFNKVYPDPYYGDNNRKTKNLIPDLADVGTEFYHYWFRTKFEIPAAFSGKRIWLKLHGINYRCDIWVNGKKLGSMAGMFNAQSFDVTSIVNLNSENVLAVNILPVDFPGTTKLKDSRPGAKGENQNGGDGEIGKNVTMLMSAGWDFTAYDGIRDRNTGIWRDVELYATGDIVLADPFVKTKLPLPDTSYSEQTISVDVKNVSDKVRNVILKGVVKENNVEFKKEITLLPHENEEIVFTPDEYKQLVFENPELWWPVNKGEQNLYTLELKVICNEEESHKISTQFGIREITSDQNTPDDSRRFLVNGCPVFVRGTNWIPEAMLKNSEERTYAELRYTRQSGLNFIRIWGGGISESDYFYDLCDQYGIMVWTEFWLTGDTEYPVDTLLYLMNMENTVKRIRNHPSLAYYVSSNESTEMPGAPELIKKLDGTRGYQMQSECAGVHDGSPYRYENPMQYFENTASKRGSRVDGFNPEYGTPCLPVYETLKGMMDKKDLWPINDSLWNYLDGGGFHQVVTKYREAVNQFGESKSIEEYAKKAQFVGAMNYRSIWEVWNYNKFNYGDRFTSGFLFWYHNCPLPQVAGRMYDYSLEPTASLYYSQNALQPLHPQFDYLKNTVSVYNDYRIGFKGYTISTKVYNLDSKLVWETEQKTDIPADGVVNDVIKAKFPDDISSIHFIKLTLNDELGKEIAESFYWRSTDKYKGAWTITGPATAGFFDISKLPPVMLQLDVSVKKSDEYIVVTTEVNNPANALSFFTQIKIQDEKGSQVKPVYFSDNFFNLLPGEKRTIKIEIPKYLLQSNKVELILNGWNASEIARELEIE